MRTITFVLRNFSRRKGQFILNSIGLILAIAVIVSTTTLSQAMEGKIGEEVEKYGPNIVVKPESQSITIPYGNVLVGRSTFPESQLQKLSTIPNAKNVRTVSPKLFGQAQIAGEDVLIVGLNPESEVNLKIWWDYEGTLPREDSSEALFGSAIMEAFNLDIGSNVEINKRSFKIVASLSETGSNDDYTVFLPLHTAQELLGQPGEVSLVEIGALCSDCPVEEISRLIMDVIPEVKASPIKQAVETRMKAVEQTANLSLTLASVVLVAGCAGVMNTMASSVHQRRREIEDTYIYRIFLYESIILGVIGGLIGLGLGIASSMLLGPLLLQVPIQTRDIQIFSIPLSVGISVASCFVASLYPTWRAAKVDPVSALKAI